MLVLALLAITLGKIRNLVFHRLFERRGKAIIYVSSDLERHTERVLLLLRAVIESSFIHAELPWAVGDQKHHRAHE